MSSPLFVRALGGAERKELRQLVRNGLDARVVRRAQMVLLSAEGKTAREIAGLWAITAQGVRKIISRFNREGIAGLADRPRKGRPPKTDDRYVELLKQAVQTAPHQLGYPFSCWTLERLRGTPRMQDPRHPLPPTPLAAAGQARHRLPPAQARHDPPA